MDSLFPFRRDRRLDYIQRDIVAYIQSPDYHFELPEISPKLWRQLNSDCTLAEQLEFLGDSLMHSFFSDGLNKHFPYEGPGFYTHVRSVLEANSTFAHLMIKVGFSSTGDPVKPAGDIFESIMAASHREQGSEVFTQYFRRNFSELIIQAGEAWKVYQSMLWLRPERERQPRAPKLHLQRPIGHGKSIERRLATKMLRRKYARKASLPIKRAMSSSEAEKRKIPEVIDLSGDNDCEMELLVSPIREMQQVSTSETQMSSSKPEYVVPGHHMSSLGSGSVHLSRHKQPLPVAMTRAQHTETHTTVEFYHSDEFSPRPCRPQAVLTSASINAEPRGSRAQAASTRQLQNTFNMGSIENPIIID